MVVAATAVVAAVAGRGATLRFVIMARQGLRIIKNRQTLLNSMLVFIAGSSYGFIVPVIKVANENGIYPSEFLPLQYLIAFIACAAFTLVRNVPWGNWRTFLPLMVLGLFTGATSICYYKAVTLLPSSVALTLLFQYVWISILIECIHQRKLPSRSSAIAVCIVLVGTVLATGLLEGKIANVNPEGIAFGVASALFYALFLYFAGFIGVGQPTPLRATMLAAGGLLITALANPFAFAQVVQAPATLGYSAGLAVLGILLPTTLINFAAPKLTAGMVSIMASTELPVGILAAWAFVGETPTPLALFGAVLVLAGVFVKQIK